MQKWKVVRTRSGQLQYIPIDHTDTIKKFTVFDANIPSKNLENILENCKDQDESSDYRLGTNHIVIHTYEPDDSNAVELPVGCYSYAPLPPYGTPALIPMPVIREDAHFETINSTLIINDMMLFINSKNLYAEMNVQHRRGYLLYGAPGNGKTALIRQLIKNPIFKDAYITWCKTVPEPFYLNAFSESSGLKVLIFEELIHENGGSNYRTDELLRMLDGEASPQNTIIISTTNYPELLAKNLGDRPSRFDMVVELPNPNADICNHLLGSFLGTTISENIDFTGFSIAHLKEVALLHKMYNISLTEAATKVRKQSQNFKNSFQPKKQLGLIQSDDE